MRTTLGVTTVLAFLWIASPAQEARDPQKASPQKIHVKIIKTPTGERILMQTVLLDVPVKKVWDAHTTAEGLKGWAVATAKADFRVGGTIKAHHDEKSKIGDPGTVTMHVLNYVPERLLTIQADPAENWPEIMKEDAKHLMNVLNFEALEGGKTRLISYGLGYRDDPKYDKILEFFKAANTDLYEKLIKYLE